MSAHVSVHTHSHPRPAGWDQRYYVETNVGAIPTRPGYQAAPMTLEVIEWPVLHRAQGGRVIKLSVTSTITGGR